MIGNKLQENENIKPNSLEMRKLKETFGFKKVAITLRTSISAFDNKWASMLFDGEDYYFVMTDKLYNFVNPEGGDSHE